MKLYGSLQNRLEEGRKFTKEIKVGTGVTEYSYSDTHAYEVTNVVDQKHFFIRKMKAIRTDNYGMSDAQSYKYESMEGYPEIEVVERKGIWYEVVEYSKAMWMEKAEKEVKEGYWKTVDVAYRYFKGMAGLTDKQREKIEEGKPVKKYRKINISVGVMQEYFDYSF